MKLSRILTIFALVSAPVLCNAEILDSLAATVNGHAILQSEWNDELRYECFVSGKSQPDLSPEERRAVLERLIDQELLREQMRSTDFKAAGREEISAQFEGLQKRYASEHGGKEWQNALLQYGISESDVAAHIEMELNSLRLIDARLRPSVQIDPAEIRNYYENEFKSKNANGELTPLREATPQIRELLVQKKMNEALSAWLESLRTQSQIHILAPSEPQVRQ